MVGKEKATVNCLVTKIL